MNIKKILLSIIMLSGVAGLYFLSQRYFDTHKNHEKSIEIVVENPVGQIVDHEKIQLDEQIAEQKNMQPKPLIDITSHEMLHDILSNKKEKAIIFFHMTGCGWCKKMEPVYQQVAENPAFASIQFYSANGKDCNAQVVVKELCDQQIQGYPTLIFMNEQGYLDKQVGFAQPENFEEKISKIFFGHDEPIAPVEVKKEVDNVKIQGGSIADGESCNGGAKWSGDTSDACDTTGGDGNCLDSHCYVCKGVKASNGSSGVCDTDAGCNGGNGCGASCTGKSGNNSGGGACAAGYKCAVTQEINGKNVGFLAIDGQKGTCVFGGKTDSTKSYYIDNIRDYAINSMNQQICKGASSGDQGTCTGGFACVTTTSGMSYSSKAQTAKNDTPLYTVTSSSQSGDYLIPAPSGATGMCFTTTGLQTTGQTTTIDGTTATVYTSGGAGGTYGQSGMCSGSNDICVGAFEGALGTCCQGNDVMNCMVSDTQVATYGQLGTCMESQQSYIKSGDTSCTGDGTKQADCSSGYVCAYHTSTDTIEVAPSGISGYCVLDEQSAGYGTTENLCSISGAACLGEKNGHQGTCCTAAETGQEDLVCLVNTESSTSSNNYAANEYATYGEIGTCAACSTSSCTAIAGSPQGNCCPGMQCNENGTNTAITYSTTGNNNGTCYSSTSTTNCATQGNSCSIGGSAPIACCSPYTCMTEKNDVYTTVTSGAGTCM